MKFFNGQNQKGDTIVEVLIGMTILAVVLATAYTSTSRSLHFGINAQMRDQALLIGQQQVELLKKADLADHLSNWEMPEFCINDDLTLREVNVYSHSCPVGSQAQFEYIDRWQAAQQTFSTSVYWQDQGNLNQVVLIYKGSDSHNP